MVKMKYIRYFKKNEKRDNLDKENDVEDLCSLNYINSKSIIALI